MAKFIELEKGKLIKKGKEYEYVLEVPEDFLEKKVGNVRFRIIEETPLIEKVRTRYDPEIKIYGDKGASLELLLGYDPDQINKAGRWLLLGLSLPFLAFYFFGFFYLLNHIPQIRAALPFWFNFVLILLILLLIYVIYKVFKGYFSLLLTAFAEYLKARDLKKILAKEGFKQEEREMNLRKTGA